MIICDLTNADHWDNWELKRDRCEQASGNRQVEPGCLAMKRERIGHLQMALGHPEVRLGHSQTIKTLLRGVTHDGGWYRLKFRRSCSVNSS